MDYFLDLVSSNIFIKLIVITILLDLFMGTARAFKERKFNSCVGIDGGIRKVAMIGCVIFLMFIDIIINFNFIFLLPESWAAYLPSKIGLCEFFSIMFILYEFASVLKNMLLCGLPIPAKLRNIVENLLNTMTDELEEKEGVK